MKTLLTIFALAATTTVQLVGSNWIATTDNDLNTATNWYPNVLPTPADETDFDNTVSGINLNPTTTGTNFSVADIHFVNQAQPFTFQINNASLVLNNQGVTGTNTNATFNVSNVDTVLVGPDQVSIPSALGSGIYNVTNSGTTTATTPGGSQVGFVPRFQFNIGSCTMGDGMQINLANTGVDNSTAGGNTVGVIGNQGLITGNIAGGDNISIIYINSGTNNTTSRNTVGTIGNPQIGFQAATQTFGNNLNLYCSNSGINHSQVVNGNNAVGVIDDPQMEFGTILAGDNVTLTAINTGVNTGMDFSSNIGITDGPQIAGSPFSVGNNLTIKAFNSGEQSGPNGGSNNVGLVPGNQVTFYGAFQCGDDATVTLSNQGTDSSPASLNQVGFIDGNQLLMYTTATFGKNCNVNVNNEANNTGGSNNVGAVAGSQMFFTDLLTMDDGTSISATNSGTVDGSQITLNDDFKMVSGRGSFTAINSGTVTDSGILIT